jgi:hypothetical protein
MAHGVRLRQICLVAAALEPAASDIADIMGLTICYRDPQVEQYGLENALLPVGSTLLELVAPIVPGTAAGRFLEKSGGRGGYMVILSCDDPDERGRHAEKIGVRIANAIEHPPYYGVQLHPRDCRAAFIEFNHTAGSDNVLGPYPPAGPRWHEAIRTDRTTALLAVELQSPDPHDLAAHWSRIIGLAATPLGSDRAEIVLPNATLQFVSGDREAMTALTFAVGDVADLRDAAAAKGLAVSDNSFRLAGVDFRLTS